MREKTKQYIFNTLLILLIGLFIGLTALAHLHDLEHRRNHKHSQDQEDDIDFLVTPNSDGSISITPF